ncbi:MAG TPA: glycosyltransferase [Lachnospiraceae bacterium]|nr:glycosyltransferase [Lachnospiraceae bacterium]HPF29542.1 glycosyltransferase [Lachnospiraceae bacterium]
MKFTIIVVSLNAGEELKRTVDSILAQQFYDYEILIKDGESKDGSLELLQESEKIRIISQKDTSIYDAMNQAVIEAKGEYYLFLNCGDYFYNSEVLSTVAEFIQKKNSLDGNATRIFYGDLYRRTQGLIDSCAHTITDFVCYRNIPCHQVCFYDRALFEQRGYDLTYPVRADYEHFLWCRYAQKAECHYIPVVVASYEGGGFSETKENLKKADLEHKVITKKYLGGKCYWYRLAMILTLQPLRKRIAKSKHLSGLYQKLKKLCYQKERKSL